MSDTPYRREFSAWFVGGSSPMVDLPRESDELYIDDCVILPRGDVALWVGVDFPCPEKVNMRCCHIIGGFYAPRFWSRSRLSRLRPLAARLSRLRAVDRALR